MLEKNENSADYIARGIRMLNKMAAEHLRFVDDRLMAPNHPCPWCKAAKKTPYGLCPKCSRFSNPPND